MHDGDVHAALHQTVGGFEAEQTAADHNGVLVARRSLNHALDVLNVAKADDARKILARKGQHDRVRAGGDQQAIVRHPRAFGGNDFAGSPIDHLDHFALAQRDAVILVPLLGVEHDVVDGLLAGEHGRQQNSVVIAVWFGTEDGDLIEIGRTIQQHFDRADAGHAVADHHQLLLVYFLEHALPSDSDGPLGDAALRRRLAGSIDDWEAPIGGQRIIDYDDRDLFVFKTRANTRPV